MRKKTCSALAAGAVALSLSLGTGSASAAPGTTTNVKVGGPKVAYSAQADEDKSGGGCPSTAWIIGRVKWELGQVSKSSIQVRKITVYYRTATQSMVAGQYLQRGNYNSVWTTRWTAGPIPGDTRDHSQTYTINKNVPLDGNQTIQFTSNVSLGGAGQCGTSGSFVYKLRPVS
ncbi:hypothetical protein [Streptomyces chrestomyceticus]|uniref:hypothetical protein n=1 Tax=Streptomyces chrestomyceticus TaxID=68185 RepID=UPI0019D1FCB5|nr:hypothetical protein [Streptomyces chrestomyceticus]